jgi:spore coat protein H
MQQWHLDLGEAPWSRLADGCLEGLLRTGGGDQAEQALPCVVSIRGAHSRQFPRKSLQVDLASEPLVDGPPEGHLIRRVHLNADHVDPTIMRSALSFSLFEQVGAPAPRWRHTALWLSGAFAGLYLALESVDRDFCLRRGWAPGPIYYALNRNGNFGLLSPTTGQLKEPLNRGYKLVEGARPEPLCRLLQSLNLTSNRAFERGVARWVDVEGYLRWLMVAVFVGNRDGFAHNYALWQEPDSGRFSIIPWDYDATWGIDIHGRPARVDRVPVTGWNRLTGRLLAVPRYRNRYRELFLETLDGAFAPSSVDRHIQALRSQIEPWVDRDRQRWSDSAAFATGIDGLRSWAEARRGLLRHELSRL